MQFTFLKNNKVAFARTDAEQAEWTQQELTLLCTFPFTPGKTIERGMVVLFQDPATNDWQAYEIRNCTLFPGESYQQFTAESLAVSELHDCIIQDDIELTNVTAASALQRILPGTNWQIGTNSATNTSFGDLVRGSVWDAISTIQSSWNVYIMPRVTVNASGIVGRFLDILPPTGVWRGLRISIDKNVADPCVTYDDSELYTALYGYGATVTSGTGEERVSYETTFAGVVWNKTADHPAKPAGQKYLEFPEMTALYGRNGKPRFGYFQNTDIKDPKLLLQKTWESLKSHCEPKISVTGTVTDLKRLGYADVPLRLHDMAIVDLNGVQLYKQVTQLTVNLLDPTGNTPTIGDYIPNIIYINRETEAYATDGSVGASGGGGGRGGSRSKKQEGEFRTHILANERNIDLNAQQINEKGEILRQAGMFIDPITGVLIYAEDNVNNVGSKFRVQSDRITAEVSERTAQGDRLESQIKQTSREISLEVRNTEARLSSAIKVNADNINLKVNSNGVISAINMSPEQIDISASRINLTGYVTASDLAATNAYISNLVNGYTTAVSISATKLSCNNLDFAGNRIYFYSVKTTSGTTVQVMGHA